MDSMTNTAGDVVAAAVRDVNDRRTRDRDEHNTRVSRTKDALTTAGMHPANWARVGTDGLIPLGMLLVALASFVVFALDETLNTYNPLAAWLFAGAVLGLAAFLCAAYRHNNYAAAWYHEREAAIESIFSAGLGHDDAVEMLAQSYANGMDARDVARAVLDRQT
jgi:hypothetical protein